LGDRQGAETLADVLAGEAGVDEHAAAHGDRRIVVDAVVVDALGVTVRIDGERRVIEDKFGRVRERAVVLNRVVASQERGDAAVGHRTGHHVGVAADAAEVDVRAGGRAVEAGVGAEDVGDEITRAGGAGDQAAAVDLPAADEIARELGEAVEVQRAAEGMHEILLARAIDGVAQTEADGAAGEVGGAAEILPVAQQQGAGARLGEVRAGDDLTRQVDGDAVHDLQVAVDRGRGRAELETGHRQGVGDGRGTGGAAEEQVAGGERKGRELGSRDVARGRIGDGEGVQGRTHRGEVITRVSGGDLGGGGRDQGGVGEGRRAGVARESDDGSAGGGSDREVLSRSRGRGVGAEDEGRAVRD